MQVLIAGDFCPQCRVSELIEKTCFSKVLGVVKNITKQMDYSIVNLECPVCYGGEHPIEKNGENLRCGEEGVAALKWAGFDAVTLANNHFFDFGTRGVEQTISTCNRNGIDVVGGGMNLCEASRVLFKTIKKQTLAIINCCEHEFSIATDDGGGSNPLNPIQQFYAIKDARDKADYVLVIVHGGNEYYQLPSPRMQEVYRFFIDTGADAVINHHQHCFSGYEIYKGKPIVYGVGNFCFDNPRIPDKSWSEGYLVILNLGIDVSMNLIPYSQCDIEPSVRLLEAEEVSHFNEEINHLNSIIADSNLLSASYKEFLHHNESLMRIILSPYENRIIRKLCRKHIIPAFLSHKKKLELKSYLQCESHLPKIMHFLNQ